MFSAVREQKKLEVRGRGLMSFPQDSVQDIEGIQAVAAMLDSLEGFKDFTSPTTGLKLVVDRHFSAQMFYYFLVGDYEQSDFELIGKHLRQDDVVLELGGGVGLTGALIGQVTRLIQQGFSLVDFAAQSFVFRRVASDSTLLDSAE